MNQTEIVWCWCVHCKRWFVEVDKTPLRKRMPVTKGVYNINCQGAPHTIPTVPAWAQEAIEAEPKGRRKRK